MDVLRVLDYYGLLKDAQPANMRVMLPCPFHDDKQASLHAYADDESFHCFGCGFHGKSVDFVQRFEGMDGLEALTKLTKIGANTAPEFNREQRDNAKDREIAFNFFMSLDKPDWNAVRVARGPFRDAMEYMFDRGFEASTLKRFDVRLNIMASHQLVIPLYQGDAFKGYVGRRIDDEEEPKYLYNEGFQKTSGIIGIPKMGPIMVVEGVMDLMKAWQGGFRNTVALLGWHMSTEQFRVLDKYATTIINALDNDRAGKEGTKRLKEFWDDDDMIRFPYRKGIKDIGEMDSQTFAARLIKVRKQIGG